MHACIFGGNFKRRRLSSTYIHTWDAYFQGASKSTEQYNHRNIHIYMHACIFTGNFENVSAIHIYLHTYIHIYTYIHTSCLSTYMDEYSQGTSKTTQQYIHTYIHKCMLFARNFKNDWADTYDTYFQGASKTSQQYNKRKSSGSYIGPN